jgi:hypothetical protein
MFTSLDLLIIAVMALAAAGMLSLALMFLIRNEKVRRICLSIVAALAVYMGYVGFRIHFPGFLPQMILALVLGLVGVGAVVLAKVKKDNKKVFLTARIMASVAMVAGMLNAFL